MTTIKIKLFNTTNTHTLAYQNQQTFTQTHTFIEYLLTLNIPKSIVEQQEQE